MKPFEFESQTKTHLVTKMTDGTTTLNTQQVSPVPYLCFSSGLG